MTTLARSRRDPIPAGETRDEDGARPPVLRRLLLPVGLVLGAGLLALGAQAVFDPFRQDVPLCLLYHATGLYCPGCGATRAVHALLDGDLLLALHNNLLLVLAIPPLGVVWLRWVVRALRGLPAPAPPSSRLLLGLLAVAVVYAVLRNLPVFALLAPTSLIGA